MRCLFALTLARLIVGCDSPTRPNNLDPLITTSLPTTVVLQMQASGLDAPRRPVFREMAGWTAFWDQATRINHPQPEPPAIDFEHSMVIVAAMGVRPSGGHSVTNRKVLRSDGTLDVVVREVSPGPGCVTSGAITSPVVAVRVPRNDAIVRFEVEELVASCG